MPLGTISCLLSPGDLCFPGAPPPRGVCPLPLLVEEGGTTRAVGVGREAESKWQAGGGRLP